MKKIKISETIQGEIFNRELFLHDYAGASVYQKIADAAETVEGSVTVLLDDAEFKELLEEANYWNGPFNQFDMPKGIWLAWKALAKQMKAKA